MLSTVTRLAGAGFCIVSCMDPSESAELYPYRVIAGDLTNNEIRDLSHLLHADVSFGPCEDPNDIPLAGTRFQPTLKEPVEFWLKHSNVLLPIAGAMEKSALQVLAVRMKKWLANRPEDRTVTIYGPDNQSSES